MNIDWFKFLILLIIGLIVVGPEKLPLYARKTAKLIRNFQKVINVLSGQFSKVLDLDDEEGNASGFKKDLMAVKKSLELDVAELKATLDSQARAVSETVESGVRDASTRLKKNANEISDTVNTQVDMISSTLDPHATTAPVAVETVFTDDVVDPEHHIVEAQPTVESPPPPGEPDSPTDEKQDPLPRGEPTTPPETPPSRIRLNEVDDK